jgi:hypothetical protein
MHGSKLLSSAWLLLTLTLILSSSDPHLSSIRLKGAWNFKQAEAAAVVAKEEKLVVAVENAPTAAGQVVAEEWVKSSSAEVHKMFTKREQEVFLRHMPVENHWVDCLSPSSVLMPADGRVDNLATLTKRWNGPIASSMAPIAQVLAKYNLTMLVSCGRLADRPIL